MCLKEPQMRVDNLSGTYSDSQVIRWSKLSRYWKLKDKKNSTSSMNNHLLECIRITVICSIYSYKLSLHYPDILFDVQTAYSSTKEREREKEKRKKGNL